MKVCSRSKTEGPSTRQWTSWSGCPAPPLPLELSASPPLSPVPGGGGTPGARQVIGEGSDAVEMDVEPAGEADQRPLRAADHEQLLVVRAQNQGLIVDPRGRAGQRVDPRHRSQRPAPLLRVEARMIPEQRPHLHAARGGLGEQLAQLAVRVARHHADIVVAEPAEHIDERIPASRGPDRPDHRGIAAEVRVDAVFGVDQIADGIAGPKHHPRAHRAGEDRAPARRVQRGAVLRPRTRPRKRPRTDRRRREGEGRDHVDPAAQRRVARHWAAFAQARRYECEVGRPSRRLSRQAGPDALDDRLGAPLAEADVRGIGADRIGMADHRQSEDRRRARQAGEQAGSDAVDLRQVMRFEPVLREGEAIEHLPYRQAGADYRRRRHGADRSDRGAQRADRLRPGNAVHGEPVHGLELAYRRPRRGPGNAVDGQARPRRPVEGALQPAYVGRIVRRGRLGAGERAAPAVLQEAIA